MTSRICLLALAAGALALAGCGDDDKKEEKSGGGTKTLNVSVDAQRQLTGVQPVPSGLVKVDFSNQSKARYDLQLVRVDGARSAAQVLKVIQAEGGKIPGWIHGAGGLGTIAPGASATATQVLEPGTYYAVSSLDQDDSQAKPLTAKFDVTGEAGSGTLPKATAKVAAFEYGFTVSGLKTGRNTVEFSNTGNELHHMIASQIAPGKTLADVKKFFQSNNQGQPPLVGSTFVQTAVLDGGAKQVVDLDFTKPGNYAVLCFISDRAGGPPHVQKGMLTETQVKAG